MLAAATTTGMGWFIIGSLCLMWFLSWLEGDD